jgi:response regulator RpfG family c-di-GMP phosphodiesterase
MYETYNGAGLPHGLRLNEVPTGSLILLISDTFDYMTRISNIPAPTVYNQISDLRFFPDKLIEALQKTQQIDSMPTYSNMPHMEAIIISRRRFDVDDIAEKLNRLNVKTYKAEKIEKAAQIIKERKDTLNFILCDVDIPDSNITPLKLLSAIKHKKALDKIPFYFFSQFSIEKNTLTTARALKATGVFPNYHPVEMTRKIVKEVQQLKNGN